jgi:hypothetical protein
MLYLSSLEIVSVKIHKLFDIATSMIRQKGVSPMLSKFSNAISHVHFLLYIGQFVHTVAEEFPALSHILFIKELCHVSQLND